VNFAGASASARSFPGEIRMALAPTSAFGERSSVRTARLLGLFTDPRYAAGLVYGGVTCSEDDCLERETRR